MFCSGILCLKFVEEVSDVASVRCGSVGTFRVFVYESFEEGVGCDFFFGEEIEWFDAFDEFWVV